MPYRSLLSVFLVLALQVAGCRYDDTEKVPAPSVTIMTFNVENLFDNEDDPGKNDETYLPLAAKQNDAHRNRCNQIEVDRWREQCLNWDWSDELITYKLKVLAETIRQVDRGRGPDIIALQEIENVSILNRLREQLAGLGYAEPLLIEGDDLRGIDVAFLSRVPVRGAARLHPIHFDDDVPPERVADTRGILEATFELSDGSLLTGFAVHFPAPFHPTGMRVSAYETLNSLLQALPAEQPAFAAGDFNTTSTEDQRENLLGRFVREHWTIAHELGCGDDCRGTAYYARDDSWSFLDMILWSPARRGENATWTVRADSVRLANLHPEQRHEDGTPKRFNAAEKTGVSDHWPLIMTLEIK